MQRIGHNPIALVSICILLQSNRETPSTGSLHEEIRLAGSQLTLLMEVGLLCSIWKATQFLPILSTGDRMAPFAVR